MFGNKFKKVRLSDEDWEEVILALKMRADRNHEYCKADEIDNGGRNAEFFNNMAAKIHFLTRDIEKQLKV